MKLAFGAMNSPLPIPATNSGASNCQPLYSVGGLSANTTYYMKVKARGVNGAGG